MMADYEELLMDLLIPSNSAIKFANKTQLRYNQSGTRDGREIC